MKAVTFERGFERLISFLSDLRRHQASVINRKGRREYVESREINRVVYTAQQAIGSVGDSFDNPNQSRYSVALNRLDGVYYVDPLPEMTNDARLRAQIFDFQKFLVHDLWTLSAE